MYRAAALKIGGTQRALTSRKGWERYSLISLDSCVCTYREDMHTHTHGSLCLHTLRLTYACNMISRLAMQAFDI